MIAPIKPHWTPSGPAQCLREDHLLKFLNKESVEILNDLAAIGVEGGDRRRIIDNALLEYCDYAQSEARRMGFATIKEWFFQTQLTKSPQSAKANGHSA